MAPPRPPAQAVEKALIVQPSRMLRRRMAHGAFLAVCAACAALAFQTKRSGTQGDSANWSDGALPVSAGLAENASIPLRLLGEARLQMEGVLTRGREFAALQEDVARLRLRAAEADILRAENERLKSLLHFQDAYRNRYITGRSVAAYDNGQSRQALLLINGADPELTKGGLAVVSEAGLAGRLTGYEGGAGRMMLLNDADSRVPVITSRSSERAILAGASGPFPRLDLLREEHKVVPGETVVTSGDGGTFPPDIPVGTVIDGGDDGLLVMPFAAPSRLRDVSVIIPERNEATISARTSLGPRPSDAGASPPGAEAPVPAVAESAERTAPDVIAEPFAPPPEDPGAVKSGEKPKEKAKGRPPATREAERPRTRPSESTTETPEGAGGTAEERSRAEAVPSGVPLREGQDAERQGKADLQTPPQDETLPWRNGGGEEDAEGTKTSGTPSSMIAKPRQEPPTSAGPANSVPAGAGAEPAPAPELPAPFRFAAQPSHVAPPPATGFGTGAPIAAPASEGQPR